MVLKIIEKIKIKKELGVLYIDNENMKLLFIKKKLIILINKQR